MRLAVVALLVVGAARAGAQLRLEQRIDAVRINRVTRPELGVGLMGALGAYVRSEAFVSYDFSGGETGAHPLRVESQIRFLLDPLAERRWGLSFAGGLGVKGRAYMVAAADLEGPSVRRFRPAIQIALGGGVRLGVVLRYRATGRR